MPSLEETTETSAVAQIYNRFATEEADGVSPLYASFARAVVSDADALALIAQLPRAKQQPNLVFAAIRWLLGTPDNAAAFLAQLLGNAAEVRDIVQRYRTQTNEPARCAVFLPALAQLEQPLALLEVGASAGLCLFPDQYAYRYRVGGSSEHVIRPSSAHTGPRVEPPEFVCEVNTAAPLPTTLPEIVWRGGIDLNPIDLDDDDMIRWLENLIWPEHDVRLRNFRAARAVARVNRARITQSDLLDGLMDAVDLAPRDATLVIFHSAVLAYVAGAELRQKFVREVQGLISRRRVVWLSNEHPSVFPDLAARSPQPPPATHFLLCRNGQPVGFSGPHGQSLTWLD